MKTIYATDIDNTLTGDREALDRLVKKLETLRQKKELFLMLITGRRLDQVISGQLEEGLPQADAVVCQVGTEIYIPPLEEGMAPLAEWRDLLLSDYSREKAVSFLDGIEGMIMQPDLFNTELKTSCYLDKCPDPEAAAKKIQERVAPFKDKYQVVWSSGRDLDILPAKSGKGKAIEFLINNLKLTPEKVVVAGDSGNDSTMFNTSFHGVVVANAKDELKAATKDMDPSKVFQATKNFAAGVEEGLEFFKVI